MTCKNCNIALVWLAGALLGVSLLFPNGFASKSAAPVTPEAPKPTNPAIVKLLDEASDADLARIRSVYTGLARVLQRDAGKRITTTEQWEELAAATLQLAIDEPGKYAGLDEAIEAVFVGALGDDVLPNNADTRNKLIGACEIVVNSAER